MSSTRTTFEETPTPFIIRAVSTVTSALEGMGVSLIDIDFAKMKAKAEEKTGLSDWHDQAFLRDLETFVDYAKRNPDSAFISKTALRTDIMRHLTNYLKLQDAKKRYADLVTQPLKNPIIILGLPRTGTTLIQRLLSQDPTSHGPALWELFNPVRIGADNEEENVKAAASFVKTVRGTSLPLWSIHTMEANEADECAFLLSQSIGNVPLHGGMTYFDWYMKRSALPDYQLHKQYLQAMHYKKTPRRWVLKSPLHMAKLDDLLTVYPDAHVIWCHRGLSHVIASWVSYMALSKKIASRGVDSKQVARDWMRIWDVSLKEAQKARDSRFPEQFFDLNYDELVSDPILTVRKIYTYFGMTLTIQAEAKMRDWLERDKLKTKPGHRYNLESFGLTPTDLDTTFADYIKKYNVSVD